jgi:hypothetical protein
VGVERLQPLRAFAIAASAGVLCLAGVLAASAQKGPSYTVEEVIEAFSRQGFALAEAGQVPGGGSQSITAVFSPGSTEGTGTFLFPAEQDFYVLVARNDSIARTFLEPLRKHPGGPGTLDTRRRNVVVSSDASLTDTGLQWSVQQRIRVAMDSLGWDGRSFVEAFDKVELGMSEAEVFDLLGRPVEQLGPGGAYPPPLEGTPTRIWYYGPNVTYRGAKDPIWAVGFRDGRVLLLHTPD